MAPPRLPLNALCAFEATVRLGSMSAAAGALGVTQGAHVVAPFGFAAGPHELTLWIAPHLRLRSDVRRFADWIENEMAESKVLSSVGAA